MAIGQEGDLDMQIIKTCPTTGLAFTSTRGGEWAPQMGEANYHADKRALSSSGVRKAVKSAATFRDYWTGKIKDEETDAMLFGRLAHISILEPTRFMEGYKVMPDFGDMRSSANRAKRDAWTADQKPGTIVVTEEECTNLTGMLKAITEHEDARMCLTNGTAELAGYYRDDETGLLCRFKPDFFSFDGRRLADIKTTKDCDAWFFGKDTLNRLYHVQLAMYCEGLKALTGVEVKFPTLIAVEKKPPYEVAVYVLDDAAMELGRALYRRALRRIKLAIDSGVWAKYQTRAQNLALPAYAFYDDGLAVDA